MYILFDYKSDNFGLTVSSVKAPFSVDALKTDYLSDIFKFDGNTGYIRIDFEAVSKIDSVGIASNVSSSGTIKVKGTDSSAFSSFEEELIFSGTDVLFENFKSMNYRYYEIEFNDSSVTDIEIGRFAMGESLLLNDMRPQPIIKYDTTDIQNISRSGQSYGVKGYTFTIVEMSWPDLSENEKDALYLFKKKVQTYKPFFIEFNCLEQIPLYAIMEKGFALTRLGATGRFSGSFSVRQVF